HGLAEERLGGAGSQTVRNGDHLVGGLECSRADQHCDLPALIEHLGGTPELRLVGHYPWPRETDPRVQGAMGAGWLLIRHLLQVVGQDDGSDAPLTESGADGAIHQMTDLGRRRRLLYEGAGHVLEEACEVDLLLVMAAHGRTRLLAGDGEHRHVIEARVVEAGHEMRGARTRSRDAD